MIKLKAYAKLNLNLHIIPRPLKNGLYPVKFINCQLDLHDNLFFERIKNKIQVISDSSQLAKTEDNLIYKAAILLKKNVNNPSLGAKIRLEKNIPVKAGLAGGSSDAAAAIKGLAKLWQVNLDRSKLNKLAKELGKDVHYCLQGGMCQIECDGSKVIPLSFKLPKFWLVIIIPNKKKPSTEWMYNNLDVNKIGKNLSKLEKIKQAIRFKDKKNILENLYNDFESLATNCCLEIISIKNDLKDNGALKTVLAGSGLAMVGFFNEEKKAKATFNNLKVRYKNILWTETI
ncbi:4-(cytidine 5'-diphospho)-2-C-methyl-D-erythritol kinase [Candidatus Roizmanbacteria bacterium CG22_combo_CG10-13_8_21_14_all_35_9]|uniref:4-diphosphocytidyl-2-C-methyl-D-erythritol kinase n=4 Tax=Candidatus Roizmaniibacteriota TaxID=1752723 RepID=A0A2M8F474_9BACT|nr:MAG: 4-(cytidine 5'-diphospho)-2-C-methyl-D-erythritol kinase [Candidatus Roizmanbacteria bacterium CG23_combo_of_CG06-09_8_20_14_all_35_49]PIP62690.1 MAG: 4-(cytidine 5'-diphospho)-2-C-methyl-D-erythritol kinase [Candidatus Roizmanbacteria bacterium CG22_combo_CG10-13_8_21_14_all_35_9]PIY71093.1 MAG: 4-(cytidine 5'-diphospho)-2-C-methyl-D-erythritol kinase [Candidatus Roizmanbacteria bacterium CG_4_10_14_0_8_um_filter_35_28]PJC34095.1 MAG: 4-(cytidine 5'-diphospho)-2-C-methyl-D-erythritol ki